MSYLEDIKTLQEICPSKGRQLNINFTFKCNEWFHSCETCTFKPSCKRLAGTLQIPLFIIEEALKSHPELLI